MVRNFSREEVIKVLDGLTSQTGDSHIESPSFVQHTWVVELISEQHLTNDPISVGPQTQSTRNQRVESVGSSSELIENTGIDIWVVGIAETRAETQLEVVIGSLADDQWNELIVDDMLELGDDNAFRLLVEDLIVPGWVQLGQHTSHAVVFSHPDVVEHRKIGDLIDTAITG